MFLQGPRALPWGAAALVLFLLSAIEAKVAEAPVNDLLRLPAAKTARPDKGLLLDVARAGERLVAVGEQGRIVTSDDSGATWVQAEVPVCVTLTSVCFPTAQQGWAVGHDGVVLHSSDGGRTWVKQLDGTQLNATAYAQIEKLVGPPERREAAADPAGLVPRARSDLEIYLEDLELVVEEGATWPFLDVWFADEREGFAVGAFGMAAHTVDGGVTWEPILDRLGNAKGLHYYGLAAVGRDLFLVGEEGGLRRSEDGGKTWKALKSPYEGTFFGVIGTSDATAVVVYGLRGKAFRSRDRGESWTPLAAPVGSAWMGASLLTDGTLLLSSPAVGGVRSTDGGVTFAAVPGFPVGAVAAASTRDGGIAAVGTAGAQVVAMNEPPPAPAAEGAKP